MAEVIASETTTAIEGRSPSRLAWERLKRDKTAWVSFSIVSLFILLAVAARATRLAVGSKAVVRCQSIRLHCA